MIEERDDDGALSHTSLANIEFVATPHPSLPLKGGGEESKEKYEVMQSAGPSVPPESGA